MTTEDTLMTNVRQSEHPMVLHAIHTLRSIETADVEYRRTMNILAPQLVFEALATLEVSQDMITTPVSDDEGQIECYAPYLTPTSFMVVQVLGAAAGFDTALAMFDLPHINVRRGFLAMSRDHDSHEPTLHYDRIPDQIDDDVTLVYEPMCATGGSLADAVQLLKDRGAKRIICICVLAAKHGLRTMQESHPDVEVFVGRIDPELNDDAYIVPGLGDAGDRYLGC